MKVIFNVYIFLRIGLFKKFGFRENMYNAKMSTFIVIRVEKIGKGFPTFYL